MKEGLALREDLNSGSRSHMKVRCNGTDVHNLSAPLKKWKVESGGFPEAGNSANMVSIASGNKRLISNKVEDEECHWRVCSDLCHIEPILTPRNTHA